MTRLRMLQVAGAASLAACAIVACADVFGVHNADVDASIDGALDGGEIDALDDFQPDYQLGDVVDLDQNTALCDGDIVVVGADAAVWVSSSGGTDGTSCGTQDSPCKTVGYAVNLAGAKYVYLANDEFDENVALGPSQAGLTIQGGFERTADAGWVASCNDQLSWIRVPEAGGPVAVDIQGAPDVTLRLLKVSSKQNGTPGSGESVYAVRVLNSDPVTLDNVILIAQHGGDGLSPAPAAQAAGCVATTGGTGAPGGNGNPGGAGSFAGNGFTPATAQNGSAGAQGQASSGDSGNNVTCNVSCTP